MRIEFAHLYVEKYRRNSNELIVDFIKEDEFIFFRNRGDYTPEMHLSVKKFEPTMMLIHDCVPRHRIKEGMMLAVRMDELIELARIDQRFDYYEEPTQYRAMMFFCVIDNGTDFAALIDDDTTLTTNNIPSSLHYHLTSTWDGSPCALEQLRSDYELRIWDVGQGSTNSIADQENLTLFDFGASIHYSKQRREAILNKHTPLLVGKRVSLIVSHWDCDHINLLCDVDNDFLINLCCVFYPPGIISLTAKQIAARMKMFCGYRVEISPRRRRIWNKCGIQQVYGGSGYALYTGENSREPNQSGLFLALNSKNNAALLTADHSNYQVWNAVFDDAVNNKCLHIVVPHHGGNCGRTAAQTVSDPGKAVISVGENSYGHPLPSMLTAYRRAGYTILQTDIVGDDIVITMD